MITLLGTGGSPLPVERDPLLDAVDLHGAHDFRHTYATWLEVDLPRGGGHRAMRPRSVVAGS
jgi:integrase